MDKQINVVPLGGLEEIGKNMVAIGYNETYVIVDAGMAFPDEGMLGVQSVIPNFNFIKENESKIKGLLLTHAHEDHIGAVPYFMNQFDIPIYGTDLTIGLLKNKLKYFKVRNKENLKTIKENQEGFYLGGLYIEPFNTVHSVFGSVAYVIKTPQGNVVHMGDFKMDFSPIDRRGMDYSKLVSLAEEGVELLISDSTNALREGLSNNEGNVAKELEREMKLAEGLTIVSSFSSSLPRVQSIIQIAEKLDKKIIVAGTSMLNNVSTAIELGYIKTKPGTVVSSKEFKNYPREEVVLLTTGAQGEASAGLMRLANDGNQDIKLKKNDTVILSAGVVPGNERSVGHLIDALLKKEVNVVQKEGIHTTGHGHSEDLKLIIDILKPKYLMPFHGEYAMLQEHKKLGESVGVKRENIIMASNNDHVCINKEGFKITPGENLEPTHIDLTEKGVVTEAIARDRMIMSKSGVAVVFITKKHRGEEVNIDIKLRGIAVNVDVFSITKKAEEMYKEQIMFDDDLKNNLGKKNYKVIRLFSNLFSKESGIRPMIIPFFN